MTSLPTPSRSYNRANRTTASTVAALVALALVLCLAECSSMSPQERAADAGQPIGILLALVAALVGIACPYLVFPQIANRLHAQGKFGVIRFLGHVLVRLFLFALVSSAAIHFFLFGGSLHVPSLVALGRFFVMELELLVVFVFPFALLWYWLAR